MIIADTKFEFGLAPDGTLVLMDEVLTPDSSRYWPVEGYEAALAAGANPQLRQAVCATGWSRPRSTASPGTKPPLRHACPRK